VNCTDKILFAFKDVREVNGKIELLRVLISRGGTRNGLLSFGATVSSLA